MFKRNNFIGMAAMAMAAQSAVAAPSVRQSNAHNPARGRSCYSPHQGEQEVARRIRQAERDRKRQEHRGIVKLGTYAFVGCDEQGRDTDTMRYSRRGRLLTCA